MRVMKSKSAANTTIKPYTSRAAWTYKQKETLNHLYTTTSLSYKEIGKQLNRSESSIYNMISTLRLEAKTKTN